MLEQPHVAPGRVRQDSPRLELAPEKILIVRLGSMGDVIHTIYAQQSLATQFPQAAIDWLTEPPYAKLLEHVPGLNKVWQADTKAWRKRPSRLPGALALAKALRNQYYDLAIDFQGLVKSAVLARAARPRILLGFARPRERLARLLYSCQTPISQRRQHRILLNLDLLQPLFSAARPGPSLPIEIPKDANDHVAAALKRMEISRPVLLNPGAGWATKLWAVSNYVQLAEQIELELKRPVLWTYGPGEEPLVDEAGKLAGRRVRAMPSTILQLGALCQQACLMVAADTGPLHLCVAMGTPTVALMGPSWVWRNGPYSDEDLSVKIERECPNPYRRSNCPDHFCMDIPVDQVFEAVRKRLNC